MAQYDTVIHTTAKRELEQLDADARDRLTEAVVDVAGERQPSSHQKARQMEGQRGLLRVRTGEYRAIVSLHPPELRVLRVGHRSDVYDVIDDGLSERRASA